MDSKTFEFYVHIINQSNCDQILETIKITNLKRQSTFQELANHLNSLDFSGQKIKIKKFSPLPNPDFEAAIEMLAPLES